MPLTGPKADLGFLMAARSPPKKVLCNLSVFRGFLVPPALTLEQFAGLWIGIIEHAVVCRVFQRASDRRIHPVLHRAGNASHILPPGITVVRPQRHLCYVLLTMRIRVCFINVLSHLRFARSHAASIL